MTLPMPTRGPIDAPTHINGYMGYCVECEGATLATVHLLELWASDDEFTQSRAGQPTAVANQALIAAAFNAAEAARQLGFDPIAAILAMPKLLAACELAVNGTAGERDCSNDDECGIWPAICDALSAARTREVRP